MRLEFLLIYVDNQLTWICMTNSIVLYLTCKTYNIRVQIETNVQEV